MCIRDRLRVEKFGVVEVGGFDRRVGAEALPFGVVVVIDLSAPDDYRSWARGLKAAGYATAPDYAQRLVRIIEESQLLSLIHI